MFIITNLAKWLVYMLTIVRKLEVDHLIGLCRGRTKPTGQGECELPIFGKRFVRDFRRFFPILGKAAAEL